MRRIYRRLITSIHRDEEHRLTRRAFLHTLFTFSVTAGLAGLPLAALARLAERSGPKRSPRSPGTPIVRVSDVPEGQAYNFYFPGPGHPAVLVHLPGGEFAAYDRRCTHLLCPVLWDTASGHLLCPCHHGHFDARTGAVLAGPPRRPLPRVPITVRDGVIYAVGGESRGVRSDAR